MKAHAKTANEAFYLELAVYPLRFNLAIRRFMYLWHILSRDKEELISKIYEAQKYEVNKGDWVRIMQEEREKYDILESDDDISKISQERFRNIVKKKVYSSAVKYLHDMASPHRKSDGLKNPLFEKQPYFSDRRFSREDVQLLFKLRTKMLDCKTNFEHQYANQLACRICKDENTIEDEDHILKCRELNQNEYNSKFSDVYGNTDEQYNVVKIFKQVLRRRQVFLDLAANSSILIDGPDVTV